MAARKSQDTEVVDVMKSHRRILAVAAAVAAVGAMPATASAETQSITGAVTAVLSVTPVTAAMGTVVPGSATPATATGNVVVISNNCYNATIGGTRLTHAVSGATFANALQWKVGSGTLAALPAAASPTAVWAANQPITALTGDTHAFTYSQTLTGENVASGLYTATATITAAAATCPA